MTWHFIEAALADYEAAAFYYDDVSPRVGEHFVAEFEAAIKFVCDYPSVCILGRHGTRHRRLRRFPYLIVFRLLGNDTENPEIEVIAVTHERRGDDHWQEVFRRNKP